MPNSLEETILDLSQFTKSNEELEKTVKELKEVLEFFKEQKEQELKKIEQESKDPAIKKKLEEVEKKKLEEKESFIENIASIKNNLDGLNTVTNTSLEENTIFKNNFSLSVAEYQTVSIFLLAFIAIALVVQSFIKGFAHNDE